MVSIIQPFSFRYNDRGLVNGDTAEIVLTGALATAATATSPPGSYAITQGSPAANYTISFTGAALTVATADNTYAIYLPIAIR